MSEGAVTVGQLDLPMDVGGGSYLTACDMNTTERDTKRAQVIREKINTKA